MAVTSPGFATWNIRKWLQKAPLVAGICGRDGIRISVGYLGSGERERERARARERERERESFIRNNVHKDICGN